MGDRMKLKKLIKDLEIEVKGSKEVEVTGISHNSQLVGPGHLFVAKKGRSFDGNEFIQDAISAGASAILTDLYNPFIQNIPQLIGKDIPALESLLAKRFFENPSVNLKVIGVTGTSGKTTTTYILKHLLEQKFSTGLIGTIETIINDTRFPSALTTPDCITLQKTLREMYVQKISHVAMEVSSHALSQNRVKDLLFDYALFLNLTREHLDYHENMESYASAKKKLFSYVKEGGTILISGESSYREYMREGYANVKTFGLSSKWDYYASDIEYSIRGTTFVFHANKSQIEIQSPLIGEYNLLNTIAALAIADMEGINLIQMRKAMCTLAQVPGRMEKVDGVLPNTFVDYAHKPDALEKVLEALMPFKVGKIITVFGCGGQRDTLKRPIMAKIAEKYSDHVIVTSDNPRREDPKEIISEIVKGFEHENYSICEDRREAIHKALAMAKKEDIVLIAGKGHEKMQYLETKSIPFDDVKVAKEILNAIH